MGIEKQSSAEEGFRKALEDVVPIIQAIGKHCQTLDELTGMVQLALENDGQLRLLMAIVLQKR